jgi:hypothetical protein
MADDESSDLSSISSLSPAPSDIESDGIELKKEKGILKFFHKVPKGKKPVEAVKEPTPPLPKRPASPPHDYVLADNSDIAVRIKVSGASKTRHFASNRELTNLTSSLS